MDAKKMLKYYSAWNTFSQNHPKFPRFLRAVSTKGVLRPGSVMEFTVRTEEGESYSANLKLTQEDMELLEFLKNQGR